VSDGFPLRELAALVSGQVRGDDSRRVRGVASLESAGPEDLSFLTNARYRAAVASSRAGVLLVGPGVEFPGRDLLIAPEPYVAFATILAYLHPEPEAASGVSPDASVAESARLGRDVAIGPFAVVAEGAALGDGVAIGAGSYVGPHAEVGEATVLHPRVVLYAGTVVGARCILHAGTVLGSDGFGFATSSSGVHHKIPQRGRVVVEDDVEIGANATIDRATLGTTRIGRGTKIDNLVQIAHNNVIGEHCILAAQVGLAGSVTLGRYVLLGGQVGVGDHLTVGERTMVGGQAGVIGDIPAGSVLWGTPAQPRRDYLRQVAALKRLAKK
jgi:UDP-3-O-[3-hydroxymyristoyl] glucosamine N-acyltransferase